jgi:uncharacterized membrane protein YsdA (DUF1294 family)/cold shock CspA family protein
MKKKGTIHHWNTSRGMGFIRSPKDGHDIFFHLKDYRGSTLPREGETVWFDEVATSHTRPRAIEVSTASANADVHLHRPRRSIGRKSGARSFMLLLFLWSVLGVWGAWDERLPLWAVAAVLVVNVLTVLAYAREPRAARTGRWRISETTLHILSVLGGWSGAGVAQTLLSYRSRKPSFATFYWGSVALHFAVLLGWLFWLQPRLAV